MRKSNQVCMLVDTLHKIVMLLHTSRQNKSINYCFSSKNGPLMFLLFLVTINIGLKNCDLWSQYLWLRKLTRFCEHNCQFYLQWQTSRNFFIIFYLITKKNIYGKNFFLLFFTIFKKQGQGLQYEESPIELKIFITWK